MDYRVYLKHQDVPERTVDRATVRERIDRYMGNKELRYRSWFRGQEDRPKFAGRVWARARARNQLRRMKPGQRLVLAIEGADRDLVIFKLEPEPEKVEPVDLGCAPNLEKAHWHIWGKFGEPLLRSAGRFLCKCVAQSGPCVVSRHGYQDTTGKVQWKGAAEDVFGEGALNTKDGLLVIARSLIRGHEDGLFKLRRVIVLDRSWTPDGGWVPYTGDLHLHVHFEVDGGVPCR